MHKNLLPPVNNIAQLQYFRSLYSFNSGKHMTSNLGKHASKPVVINGAHLPTVSPINTTYRSVVDDSKKYILNLSNVNPHVKQMEYAVRGPIVIKASEIENQIQDQKDGLISECVRNFSEIIRTNIGDAHAMGQLPITFFRQVLALACYPDMMKDPTLSKIFPVDAVQRAKRVLDGCSGQSIGSYSSSAGIDVIRKDIATFITNRDGPGVPKANYLNVFLSSGASEGIRNVLALLRHSEGCPLEQRTGVMVPIPQYPLYSATISEYNMVQVGYYLDESKQWALDIAELNRALDEGRKRGHVRVLVVINPGNPTGQVLSIQNMKEIIQFAYDNQLFLMADEVYQQNIYDPNLEWRSFRRVLFETMPAHVSEGVELASFYSASKGYMGECGIRGGFSEFNNLDPQVKDIYIKMISARLCPTTLGQALMECIVNPPTLDEPSGKQFELERQEILKSLAIRAKTVADKLNSIPGVSCNRVQGAMYAFPSITIPPKACLEAKANNVEPDFLFALQLLENEGLCVVPGSGFAQSPGSYHFRMTILPSESKIEDFLNRFARFYKQFVAKYQ